MKIGLLHIEGVRFFLWQMLKEMMFASQMKPSAAI